MTSGEVWLHACCTLSFQVSVATPMVFMLRPRSSPSQWVAAEEYDLSPSLPVAEFTDGFGNLCQRVVAPVGDFQVHTQVTVRITGEPIASSTAGFVDVSKLPHDTLGFLLPSRYCESDRFGEMATEIVAGHPPGYAQVVAITDWICSSICNTPLSSVNNNCSSGSSAIFLARQAVKSGAVECALAFGFEEMQPGALGGHWDDRESPFQAFQKVLDEKGYPEAPIALRCFGAAGHHYMEKYGASPEVFAKVAVKTRKHAAVNPYALFTDLLTVEEVMNAPNVYLDYLTRLMACPPTCGAGAAIVCSEEFAKRQSVEGVVEIAGQSMTTDTPTTWQDPISLIGADMTRRAARAVYDESGLGPEDVDVVELHDCFTVNEVVTYEGLGLCGEGEATRFVEDADNTYGGKVVVNPSGGLMSKGHPLGATGLAQCYELVSQIRGNAGNRQVAGAKVALQHNLGLGGAAVVTMYKAV